MDDPFVMDNPFLGLFLCLAVCGVVVVGEGWLQSQTVQLPGLDRGLGVASAYAEYFLPPNQLSAPALYSSDDQKYKSCRAPLCLESGSFWVQIMHT